jgi:hypothetical protein
LSIVSYCHARVAFNATFGFSNTFSMRLKALPFLLFILSSLNLKAQTWVQDSVVMGAGYANDVSYSLKNGIQKIEPNNNWHLGFQMNSDAPYGTVSIIANHTLSTPVNVYSLHMSASMYFNTLSATDTIGKTGASMALYNADTNRNIGAFNRMNNPANIVDYSWGIYDMNTHFVNGDSLYLVTVGTGASMTAYKIWVIQYKSTPADSIQYRFRVAKFDGSEDTTIRLYKEPTFSTRIFAYYNLATRTVLDREPARTTWDILFTRYKEYIFGAPGGPYYPVTGVLSNYGVTVSEKIQTVADTTGYHGFAYSKVLNVIGSDWKTFNPPTSQWYLSDTTYYFIKTQNTNEYYELQFTGFKSASGTVIFQKRFLDFLPTAVNNISSKVSAFAIAPNPANANFTVLVDVKERVENARLTLQDLTGRVVMSKLVTLNTGLNANTISTISMPAGIYMVTLAADRNILNGKVVIEH